MLTGLTSTSVHLKRAAVLKFIVCETLKVSSRKIMRALRVGALSLDDEHPFIEKRKRVTKRIFCSNSFMRVLLTLRIISLRDLLRN